MMTRDSNKLPGYSALSITNKIFIFLVVLLAVFSWLNIGIGTPAQNLISIIGILLLGIPHGAIDNLLYLEKSNLSPFGFYTIYIGLLGLNVMGWLMFPIVFFVLFLALSAYHFGQSQFSVHLQGGKILKFFLYFFWGLSVIMSFTYFNLAELTQTIRKESDLAVFEPLISDGLLQLFLASTVLCIVFMLAAVLMKKISLPYLASELLVLGMLNLVAFSFPFLPGFALFFIAIHSLKVMQSEFDHFFKRLSLKNVFRFIYKLLPLTLISMLGLALIVLLIHLEFIQLSLPFLMLIAISSITLPHVFVMEKFYRVGVKERQGFIH